MLSVVSFRSLNAFNKIKSLGCVIVNMQYRFKVLLTWKKIVQSKDALKNNNEMKCFNINNTIKLQETVTN